jgi:glycine/D-amino acid oxidase-like deaminating enzyme
MDAIVIGAEITGSSIAWRLRQKGLRARLLEARSAGCEASGASAGMLAPGGEFGEGSAWRAAVESLAQWPYFVQELRQQSGMAIDYRACGAQELAYSEEEGSALLARAKVQAGLGIRSAVVSDTVAARYCAAGQEAALHYSDDAIVDPREVMAALRVVWAESLREAAPVVAMEWLANSAVVRTEVESFEASMWSWRLAHDLADCTTSLPPLR